MKRSIALLAIFPLLALSALSQPGLQKDYDDAFVAWDTGAYETALMLFDSILKTTGGEAYFERIALLTGELFRTTEIAPDGTKPSWSPDGSYLSYETRADGLVTTHLLASREGGFEEVARFAGSGLVFLNSGSMIAYLRIQEGPELDQARAEARQGVQIRSREEYFRFLRTIARIDAEYTRVVIRDLGDDTERELDTSGMGVFEIQGHPERNRLYLVVGQSGEETRTDIMEVIGTGNPQSVTDGPGLKSDLQVFPDGYRLLYVRTLMEGSAFSILDLKTKETQNFEGRSPVISADGSSVAFFSQDGEETTILVIQTGSQAVVAHRTENRVENLAISPNGTKVAFQFRPREDWELMVAASDGTGAMQLTHDIQHDLFPKFTSEEVVLAISGEGRHRRSFLYDIRSGAQTRLFHNNTVRTVAPEYEWAVSRDGSKILIVSERDGDTISPERGLYLVDTNVRVSIYDVLTRIQDMLNSEIRLRQNAGFMFAQIEDEVRAAVGDVSTSRIFGYEKALFAFGSKHINQPGNAMAIEYIADQLRSFGYEPELKWFEPRPGISSANVIATLSGTTDPDLLYVLSSHFDSSERGPGSDDNTSGTAALLDAARVLAGRPQAATIQFAFFTGEEAGLLGSREFVRQAVAAEDRIVGALNNDMVGFANDNRLDNTIRYSNSGIRDVQHAAAMMFTDLITYDAKYYKSTDAHAYYEAYGDIVGGIGSYPILSSPHYHQSSDVLETINHQLVAEVSKTTVASLMKLASSPSRLTGLEFEQNGADIDVHWTPAAESTVDHYVITYRPTDGEWERLETSDTQVTLSNVGSGTEIRIKAVNARGMAGWDWARIATD